MAKTNEEHQKAAADGLALPLVPLRDTVLFPDMALPIVVGRSKSLAALKAALNLSRQVVLTCQRNPDIGDPQLRDLYEVGVLAKVIDVSPLEQEPVQAYIEVTERVRLASLTRLDPYAEARFTVIKSRFQGETPETEALARAVRERFQEVVFVGKTVPLELTFGILREGVNAEKLSYVLPQVLTLSVEEKQEILETLDVDSRLRLIIKFLSKELEVINVQEKVKKETTEQLSRMQREVILREQLKAIEKELGIQDEREDYLELAKKITAAGMPKDVEQKAKTELGRLRKMTNASPESSYIRTYLEWLTDLPWQKKSEAFIDLAKAHEILERDHYGLEKVKERILEYLAVQKLSNKLKGPILCFFGPPGVGKTSIGQSIAKSLNRKFVRVSLGGIRDEAEIRGHRRTYVGALPGRIIQGIKTSGTSNPVFMLDEIDKVGTDFRGDPSSALLEALDPEQNNAFSDHYLEVPYDLSNVLFITTANTLDTVPPALRDRLEVIEFTGYTIEEKEAIARQYLWPKVVENHGLDKKLAISDQALRLVVTKYTKEAGVRNLERLLATIARKLARQKVEGKELSDEVGVDIVHDSLGAEKFPETLSQVTDEVGVATGLAWTQAGGEILFIEANLMPGKGHLIMTGQLGEVMKESAQAALSYVRSRASDFGQEEHFLEKRDIHVHVPAGAIPKDGPSAGIAIALAIASAVSKKAIRKEVGLTGEVTIRGRVLEIGGIKEKLIAASRAGVKEVIIPADNKKNLEDVPEHVLKELKIHFVDHMDEVLPIAFVKFSLGRDKKTSADMPRRAAIS